MLDVMQVKSETNDYGHVFRHFGQCCTARAYMHYLSAVLFRFLDALEGHSLTKVARAL